MVDKMKQVTDQNDRLSRWKANFLTVQSFKSSLLSPWLRHFREVNSKKTAKNY